MQAFLREGYSSEQGIATVVTPGRAAKAVGSALAREGGAKLYEIGAGTNEIRRMLIGRELFH
ncbi:hypothetical protein ACQKIE_13670, partial [Luteibacter sp. NPDC031894]|uniref:hypothetical protein n=1 Tax=Luteibacter sp. NPDC031894 TaxID=3390572 RepID=UPI003D001D59